MCITRNHLGVMSKSALAFASDTTQLVDFTLPATDVYGSYARLDNASFAANYIVNGGVPK
ncbi:MAG: hypothetical protein PHE17_09360 [Thiothrix sp.]|nr:hypothetical protein [Thiothrix sp.]